MCEGDLIIDVRRIEMNERMQQEGQAGRVGEPTSFNSCPTELPLQDGALRIFFFNQTQLALSLRIPIAKDGQPSNRYHCSIFHAPSFLRDGVEASWHPSLAQILFSRCPAPAGSLLGHHHWSPLEVMGSLSLRRIGPLPYLERVASICTGPRTEYLWPSFYCRHICCFRKL